MSWQRQVGPATTSRRLGSPSAWAGSLQQLCMRSLWRRQYKWSEEQCPLLVDPPCDGLRDVRVVAANTEAAVGNEEGGATRRPQCGCSVRNKIKLKM
jgi:hypothetical protein